MFIRLHKTPTPVRVRALCLLFTFICRRRAKSAMEPSVVTEQGGQCGQYTFSDRLYPWVLYHLCRRSKIGRQISNLLVDTLYSIVYTTDGLGIVYQGEKPWHLQDSTSPTM